MILLVTSQHPGCFLGELANHCPTPRAEPQLGRTQRRLWDYSWGEFSDQRWSRSSQRAAPQIQLLWISVFKVLQDVYQTFVFFAAYYCDEINLVLFRVFWCFFMDCAVVNHHWATMWATLRKSTYIALTINVWKMHMFCNSSFSGCMLTFGRIICWMEEVALLILNLCC